MRPLLLSVVLLSVGGVAAAVSGCSVGTEDTDSSSSRAETDLQLARRAVVQIAGAEAKCTSCHTAGKEDMTRWADATKAIEATCMDSALSLTPMQRINCLREDPNDPESFFSAGKLGFYSAGANLAVFSDMFKAAYPADQWEEKYKQFKLIAGMPASGSPGLTIDQFDAVKAWALKGLPQLDAVIAEPGTLPCVPKTTPELAEHLTKMKADGWGARLAAASVPMSNCAADATATDCLKNFPDVTPAMGAAGTRQTLRQVRELGFRSSFWVRSSPDGRFAAFGGSPSRIIDLNAPASAAFVQVDAPYDPGFFPNNDGFSYAGTSAGGLRACKQSVLLNALAGNRRITFSEAGCTQIISTVYQSVGAALDGSLFWMATGAHTNDAGGASGPLSASFGENATTTMTPMFNDGTKYVPGRAVQVKIANEGDQQISPSNTLLITRFGQKAGHSGYRIRAITPTFGPAADAGQPSMSVALKELGTVCLPGGKPQMSFDERFLAVHTYVDSQANPEGLPTNSSNIYLHDLKTGKQTAITKLGAGQRALYPHWRADGWLYFLVKDTGAGKEYLVASDVALHADDATE